MPKALSTLRSCLLTRMSLPAALTAAKCSPSRIFNLLLLSQVILLVIAWLFMPQVIALLAPGFADYPIRGELAYSR